MATDTQEHALFTCSPLYCDPCRNIFWMRVTSIASTMHDLTVFQQRHDFLTCGDTTCDRCRERFKREIGLLSYEER